MPEAEGKRKLQINNSGQTVTALQPNGLPVASVTQGGQNQTMTAQERQARIEALTAQGDKTGKREKRQLVNQQRAQEKVDGQAVRQATATEQEQQHQQKQERKAQRKAAKAAPPQEQQSAVTQRQQKAKRKAARQQAPAQTSPLKVGRRATENKNGKKNGNPNR